MLFFRNEIPIQVHNISYSVAGGIDIELGNLTADEVKKVFDTLKSEDNYKFDPNNIKIIFSGPKTICVDKNTGQKTMITMIEDQIIQDMDDLDRIWLVIIKHILYSQNRKKEYSQLCKYINEDYDFSIYLAGLIGTNNVLEITEKFAI